MNSSIRKQLAAALTAVVMAAVCQGRAIAATTSADAGAGQPAVTEAKAKPKSQAAVDLMKLIQASPVSDGVRYVPHVQYAPEYDRCFGDIYMPAATTAGTKRPAILIVHGGAWIMGAQEDTGVVYIARQLAKHGYVAFNIEYRLIQDGGTYPASVKDVNDALGFLEANADKLGVDVSRVGVYGGSAGSFLALLAAYAPHTGPFEPTHYKSSQIKPKAVVTMGTICDVRNMEYPWLFKYMDDTPYHSPDLYAQASAVTYIKSAVPTLCEHGVADNTVPFAQSEELVKALKAEGIPAKLVPIPHSRHQFHVKPGPIREMALNNLIAFFDQYLK